MALLTADDIRYRKFAPTRLRSGYDVDEVDDFLEEVIQTVEELTRIAQNAQQNTGTFSAIQPSAAPTISDINNSPVVQGLRAENQQLQEQLAVANQAAAVSPVGASDGEKDQQIANLLQDNRDLAMHLKQAEDEIANLQGQLAAGVAGNDSDAAQKIQDLNLELGKLRSEYDEVVKQNKTLETEIDNLRNSGGVNAGEADALRLELDQVKKQLDDANSQVARLQVKVQNGENTDSGSLSAIGSAASSAGSGVGQAAAMLNMAQQLHDEYVQKGKNESERLINEGQEKHDNLIEKGQKEHDRLVTEGKKSHDDSVASGKKENERLITEATEENKRIITEAKKTADNTYETLAKERSTIEKKIEELQQFEKDYRTRLTSALTDLLGEIQED
jgi:DivIVA domain-containing protein